MQFVLLLIITAIASTFNTTTSITTTTTLSSNGGITNICAITKKLERPKVDPEKNKELDIGH